MRNWITMSISAVLLTAGSFATQFNNSSNDINRAFTEVPVMKVNVYMMGREVVDESITVKIFENIEYLNQAYQGQISFKFDELFMDPNHAYLPDLYKSFHNNTEEMVEPIVEPIEKKGGINIYLFDTYCEEGRNDALMGFTPMLSARQSSYASNSPRFDRIMMAYDGLAENKTLVHEMGHFFGLQHPWELSVSTKCRLGMCNKSEESKNHMSYGSDVEKFTPQQLESMRQYAMSYRTYLMDRVLRIYAGA